MKEEIEFGVMMNHKIFAHKTQVLFCASCPNSLIQQLNNPEDIDGYFDIDRGKWEGQSQNVKDALAFISDRLGFEFKG